MSEQNNELAAQRVAELLREAEANRLRKIARSGRTRDAYGPARAPLRRLKTDVSHLLRVFATPKSILQRRG